MRRAVRTVAARAFVVRGFHDGGGIAAACRADKPPSPQRFVAAMWRGFVAAMWRGFVAAMRRGFVDNLRTMALLRPLPKAEGCPSG